MTITQPCVSSYALDQPTDKKCRIQASSREYGSHEASGCRFAMGAAHRYTISKTHELAQHLCSGHHGNTQLTGNDDLWVIGGDRVGRDHHIGAPNIACIVTQPDLGTLVGQSLGIGRRYLV